eukprot:762128-Hanusia_phi.AAC.20
MVSARQGSDGVPIPQDEHAEERVERGPGGHGVHHALQVGKPGDGDRGDAPVTEEEEGTANDVGKQRRPAGPSVELPAAPSLPRVARALFDDLRLDEEGREGDEVDVGVGRSLGEVDEATGGEEEREGKQPEERQPRVRQHASASKPELPAWDGPAERDRQRSRAPQPELVEVAEHEAAVQIARHHIALPTRQPPLPLSPLSLDFSHHPSDRYGLHLRAGRRLRQASASGRLGRRKRR